MVCPFCSLHPDRFRSWVSLLCHPPLRDTVEPRCCTAAAGMNPYPITQSIIHLPAALPLFLLPCSHPDLFTLVTHPPRDEREREGGRWKDTLSRSSSFHPSWRWAFTLVVGWLVTPNHPDDAWTDGEADGGTITPATDIPRMGSSVRPSPPEPATGSS